MINCARFLQLFAALALASTAAAQTRSGSPDRNVDRLPSNIVGVRILEQVRGTTILSPRGIIAFYNRPMVGEIIEWEGSRYRISGIMHVVQRRADYGRPGPWQAGMDVAVVRCPALPATC